jgi:hypothetical protein
MTMTIMEIMTNLRSVLDGNMTAYPLLILILYSFKSCPIFDVQ